MPKDPWITKRRRRRKRKAKISEGEASALEESRRTDHVVPVANPATEMSSSNEIKIEPEPIYPRPCFSHSTTLFPAQGIESEQETPMELSSTPEKATIAAGSSNTLAVPNDRTQTVPVKIKSETLFPAQGIEGGQEAPMELSSTPGKATPSGAKKNDDSLNVPGTTSKVFQKDTPSSDVNNIPQFAIKSEPDDILPSNDNSLQASASLSNDLKRKWDDRLASIKRRKTDSTSPPVDVSNVTDVNLKVKEEPVGQKQTSNRVSTEIETAKTCQSVEGNISRGIKREPVDNCVSSSSGMAHSTETSQGGAGNKAPEISDEISIIEKPLERNIEIEIIDLTDDPSPCVATVSPRIENNKVLEKESSSRVVNNTANPSRFAFSVKSESVAPSEILAAARNSSEPVVNGNLPGIMATKDLRQTAIVTDSSNTLAIPNDRTQAVSVKIKSEKPSSDSVAFDGGKMEVDVSAAKNSGEKLDLEGVTGPTNKHVHTPPVRPPLTINNVAKEASVDTSSQSSGTIHVKTEPEDTPCVPIVNQNSSSAFVNGNSSRESVKLENVTNSVDSSVQPSCGNFPGLIAVSVENSTLSENNLANLPTFLSAQCSFESSQSFTNDGFRNSIIPGIESPQYSTLMPDEITRGSLAEGASPDVVDGELEEGVNGPPYNHTVEFPTPLLKYLHITNELDVLEIHKLRTCFNNLMREPGRRKGNDVVSRVTCGTLPERSETLVVDDQEGKILTRSRLPELSVKELAEKVSLVFDINPRRTPSSNNEDSSSDLGYSPLLQSHSDKQNAAIDPTKCSLDPEVLKNLMSIDISQITSAGEKHATPPPSTPKKHESNRVADFDSPSSVDYSNVPMDIEGSSNGSSQEDNRIELEFLPTCEQSFASSCKEDARTGSPAVTRDLLPIISSPLSTNELRQIIRVTGSSPDDRSLGDDSHRCGELVSGNNVPVVTHNSIDLGLLDENVKRALQSVSRPTVRNDSFETPPKRGREETNDGAPPSKGSKVKLDLQEYRMKRLLNSRDPRMKAKSLPSESGQLPLSSQYNPSNPFAESPGRLQPSAISSDGRFSQSIFAPLSSCTSNQGLSPTINPTVANSSPTALINYPQTQNPRVPQAGFAEYRSQNFNPAPVAVSKGKGFLQAHFGSVGARDSFQNIPATSKSSFFRPPDTSNPSSSVRLPYTPQSTLMPFAGAQKTASLPIPSSSTGKQHPQMPNPFKVTSSFAVKSNPIHSQSTNFMSFSDQTDNTAVSISPMSSRKVFLNAPLPAASPPLPALPPIGNEADTFMRIQCASNKPGAIPYHRTTSKIAPGRTSKDFAYGTSHLKPMGESDYIRLLPSSLKSDISNNIIHTNDVYLIIIDWGVEFILKNTTTPPPISPNFYHVRNTYSTPLEYYNTYFPLLLLECWHKVSVALKAKEKSRERKYDFECAITQFEQKQSYISVTCDTVINSSDLESIPKDGNIILVKFATVDPNKGLKMLGYVCSSASRAFSARHDQRHPTMKNFEGKDHRSLIKIKISFYITNSSDNIIKDSFSWITKISSIKKALMQNDALKELSRSPLCDVIVNPVLNKVLAVTLPQRHDKTSMVGVIQGIVQSVMNPSKPQLIVVKTTPSTDSLLAVVQLVKQIQKSEAPGKVLVCVKHDVLGPMAANLIGECSDVVIINRERERVQERHQKRVLDKMVAEIVNVENQPEDSAKCIVLQQSRVLLAVTTNCFYEDVRFLARDIQYCIVHDAHSFTEPESVLPLLYGVRFLILLGDPGESCTVNSKAAIGYDYNKSLFQRAYSVS